MIYHFSRKNIFEKKEENQHENTAHIAFSNQGITPPEIMCLLNVE